MSPRQIRKQRTVRVEDPLWDAAQRIADEKGETVSEAVRKFLERYGMTELAPVQAVIEIKAGKGHFGDNPKFHTIIIDGRDISNQVRGADIHLRGDALAEVTVTYASPFVTVEGVATVNGVADDE